MRVVPAKDGKAMNAVRLLSPADLERLELQDQLDIARQKLDAARGKNDAEFAFQLGRVHALTNQLGKTTFRSFAISREDREPYGDRQEEFEGATNGAINWEA